MNAIIRRRRRHELEVTRIAIRLVLHLLESGEADDVREDWLIVLGLLRARELELAPARRRRPAA
jgi:hypothetical protein